MRAVAIPTPNAVYAALSGIRRESGDSWTGGAFVTRLQTWIPTMASAANARQAAGMPMLAEIDRTTESYGASSSTQPPVHVTPTPEGAPHPAAKPS